jgi:hypothetical protein
LPQVDESFQAEEGTSLSSEYNIDKHVGSGSTADVYKLKPAQKGSAQDAQVGVACSSQVKGVGREGG